MSNLRQAHLAVRCASTPAWRGSAVKLHRDDCVARREFCGLLFVGAVMAEAQATPRPEMQQAPSVAEARRFVQQAGDRMVTMLNQPGDWQAKLPKLTEMIAQTMDVCGIARFALGRFWRTASDAQRDALVRLFPIVLLGELGRSVGVLQGMTFTIDRGIVHSAWVEVRTTVYRPGIASRHVEWLVGLPEGKLRIVDILAKGSSLRITQRDDVASFLAQHDHSVALLLDALRRKIVTG